MSVTVKGFNSTNELAEHIANSIISAYNSAIGKSHIDAMTVRGIEWTDSENNVHKSEIGVSLEYDSISGGYDLYLDEDIWNEEEDVWESDEGHSGNLNIRDITNREELISAVEHCLWQLELDEIVPEQGRKPIERDCEWG